MKLRDPIVTALVLAVVFWWIQLERQHAQAEAAADPTPAGVRIDPDNTVCYHRALKGWTRIGEVERQAVSELVRDGKARFTEAQTLTCIHVPTLTRIVLREQFYQLIDNKPPRRPIHHD